MHRAFTRTGNHLIVLVRYMVLRIMVASSPRDSASGIVIADLLSVPGTAARFAKLREALLLIESNAPLLMRRLQRDLRRIVFLESGPEFWAVGSTCVLHDIRGLSVVQVALLLVHEGTHARLWRSGIRYGADVRDRVERICVGAELEFLKKLPHEEELLKYTKTKLDKPWWRGDQQAARHADVIADVEAPAWLLKLYRRVMKRWLPSGS